MNTTGRTVQSRLHLQVFLASPGDVAEERQLAREALERFPLTSYILFHRLTISCVSPAAHSIISESMTKDIFMEFSWAGTILK